LLIVRSGLPFTAFVTSKYVANQSDANFFASLQSNGISIQNHTINHPDMATLDPAGQQAEWCGAQDVLDNYFPAPTLFRAPYLSYNEHTIPAAQACGLRYAISGNLAYWEDGGQMLVTPTPDYQLRRGDIVVLHFDPLFPDALLDVLQKAKQAGLAPARLDDYIG
jgi:peptidoglycan/xylan/chitin deacetylase (PgdA/CDA1 family)